MQAGVLSSPAYEVSLMDAPLMLVLSYSPVGLSRQRVITPVEIRLTHHRLPSLEILSRPK